MDISNTINAVLTALSDTLHTYQGLGCGQDGRS